MTLIVASPTESARFARPVGEASLPQDVTDDALETLSAELELTPFELVVVRYPSSQVTWFDRLATLVPWHAIFADTLLYYSWVDAGEELPVVGPVVDRGELGSDVVARMIAATFAGYRNHYFANPDLEPAAIAEGYAEWAVRVAGEPTNAVVALAVDGDPAALAVIDTSSGEWDVALAGVMPQRRGRGTYGDLITATMAAGRAAGRRAVSISTQSHNVQVIRTWERLGWRMTGAFITVHLVRAR